MGLSTCYVQASFRPNGVVGGQYGPNRIEFEDGSVIEYNMPQVTVSGMYAP